MNTPAANMPAVRQEAQALAELLEQLITQFGLLLKLFQEERKAIKKRDPERLEALAEAVRTRLGEIASLEGERQEVVGKMSTLLNLANKTPTLKELNKLLGGKTILADKRLRLEKAIQEANSANQENKAILKGVSSATDAIIDMFKRSVSSGVGYTRAGTRQVSGGRSLFSKKF